MKEIGLFLGLQPVQLSKIPLPLDCQSANKQIVAYEKNSPFSGLAIDHTGCRMQQTNLFSYGRKNKFYQPGYHRQSG
jgi:hypothetical protein